MPYKDLEVRKAYHKLRSHEHYLKTIEATKQRTKDNKKKARLAWVNFKATLKCTICGEDHPAALDFHHKDPATKNQAVSWYLKNSQFTKAKKEMKKCIVLCANCHRKHHWQEKKNPAS